jgi:hypothetical protein
LKRVGGRNLNFFEWEMSSKNGAGIEVFRGRNTPKMGICYARKMTLVWRKFARRMGFALALAILALAAVTLLRAQQAAPVPAPKEKQGAVAGTTNAEFAAAADEVLHQMSEITGLKLLTPLKKSLRSREQIRAYVINEMKEDKDQAERYAGERSAEAFGLLPKGFDLDNFMIDLLTEQIAGLYDPKTHEFYVADWIPAADQKMVMAHELTHALQDQHFKIDNWVKAARPNDDAELARESVLEGSAMAAMVDYLLQGTGRSLQDLPDIDPSMLVGDRIFRLRSFDPKDGTRCRAFLRSRRFRRSRSCTRRCIFRFAFRRKRIFLRWIKIWAPIGFGWKTT